MLEKVNLADIRAFVLIAELGSFTNAALAMDVSRSHVSRQLSALESRLGVTLMHRTTRTLRLTDAGQLFYEQAKASFNGLEQALVAAVDDANAVRGEIRINCVGGHIGEDIIAAMCSEFLQQYPDVEISLDFSSPRIDLISDQFDLAFRMGELEDAGFVGRKLCDIKIHTLASPDYIERFGSLQHPKELIDHHCLTGSIRHWKFQSRQDPSDSYEINVKGRLSCKNGRALVRAAIDGNGVIRVPAIYCQNEIETGLLQPVFQQWDVPDVPFYAIYHKDRYQTIRLKTFIRFVTERFALL